MDQTQAAPEAHITYYGGKWVAFAPILLAIVGLIDIAGQAGGRTWNTGWSFSSP